MIKYEGIGGMCMKEQFLQRMKEYLQEDYEAYVKTLEEDAYRGLRVNTTKISVEAFLQLSVCECKPSAICPETFYIPHQAIILHILPVCFICKSQVLPVP